MAVWRSAAAVAAALLTLSSQWSGPALGQGTQDSLMQRAQRGERVRVIVRVRAPFVPEGRLRAEEAARQRSAIAEVQSVVTGRLQAAAVSVRRFTSIPYLAAEVDATTLDALSAMPEIIAIDEDVAEPPALADSTSIIGAPQLWASGYRATGWTVAVLDTGVDKTHPFLAPAVVSEACFSNGGGFGGQVALCPGGAPASLADGSGVPCPTTYSNCDHGTHVAGIAAGRDYTGGPGLNGVAPGASLISIQVFTGFDAITCGGTPCVLSYASDQVAALERVYDLRNTLRIAAVNMSIGGGLYADQAACDSANGSRKAIIDQLRSAGIATVVASGNEGSPGALSAPACISSAISVGSVDDGGFGTSLDSVSIFSNTAPFLTLLAPGRWIRSSVRGGFADYGGTSMAAPHVAGAWAVLRQRKPLAAVSEVLGYLQATGLPLQDSKAPGVTIPRIRVNDALAALRVDYMAVDQPASSSALLQPFAMTGWALNMSALPGAGTGVDAVHIWAFPAVGAPQFAAAAAYGSSRPDVAAAYGGQFVGSGWTATIKGLPPGTYTLNAYARNTFNGQFSQVTSVRGVTIQAVSRMFLDAPASGAVVVQPFAIHGWALDEAAQTGSGIDAVHIYAYPTDGRPEVFLGQAGYGFSRPDVGAYFGSQYSNSGFQLTAAGLRGGRYQLVAYGRTTLSGQFTVSASAAVVVSEPIVTIDQPIQGTSLSQPFRLSGWAVDRGASSGTGVQSVHVWAYPDPGSGAPPVFLGLAAYGQSRPDVGAYLGAQFTNTGFEILVQGLPTGHVYRLATFSHSDVSGSFALRTVDVIVP